jgi:hypothetical protein
MRILKFPIEICKSQNIRAANAQLTPMCVQMQGDQPTLWAMAHEMSDANANWLPLELAIVGTGHAAEHLARLHYISTVQQGGFVWHVFANRSSLAIATK